MTINQNIFPGDGVLIGMLSRCTKFLLKRNKCFLAVLVYLLAVASGAAFAEDYTLIVDKAERRLSVINGDAVVQEYKISWGRGGKGDKVRVGDKRTPVGTYRIVDFNDDSRFDLFMQLNYPNVKDAFFGLKGGVITRDQFDAIVSALNENRIPPQNTPLGGAIGIHGLGPTDQKKFNIHRAANWTEGCIAMTNQEIHELREFVAIGTKVVIKE